jgi:D-alanine-D-alanine ligase
MSSRYVLVLSGGLSPERDVSLRSGRRVAEALRTARPGWEVAEADVDANLLPMLVAHRPDCVVPLLHGAAGEDGALRDVLETLEISFVGSTAAASRLAFDKPVAAALVSGTGIAVPEFVVLPQSTFRELGAPAVMHAVGERIGFPLVVKPTRGGSALGVSVVRTETELPPAMVSAFAYGDTAMIQGFVTGTEVALAVIDTPDGPRALPAVEIVPESGMYDYHARYTAGATEFFCPARVTDDVATAIADCALTAHAALGLSGLSRTDVVVDTEGTVWFLEVNVAPGMTETSLMPQALSEAGLAVGEVFASLIDANL